MTDQSEPNNSTAPIRIAVEHDFMEIIPMYLESLGKNANKIRAALNTGDLAPALTVGHQMKGEGAAFGFDEVSRLGELIYDAAQAGDTATITTMLESLNNYLARVVVEEK